MTHKNRVGRKEYYLDKFDTNLTVTDVRVIWYGGAPVPGTDRVSGKTGDRMCNVIK